MQQIPFFILLLLTTKFVCGSSDAETTKYDKVPAVSRYSNRLRRTTAHLPAFSKSKKSDKKSRKSSKKKDKGEKKDKKEKHYSYYGYVGGKGQPTQSQTKSPTSKPVLTPTNLPASVPTPVPTSVPTPVPTPTKNGGSGSKSEDMSPTTGSSNDCPRKYYKFKAKGEAITSLIYSFP